jgi:nicotinate-nucleotide--dimethylbenzimidazole phosphoribosyltransferase
MSVQPVSIPAAESPALDPLDEIRHLVVNDLPALPAHEPPAALRDFAPVWRWLAAAQHDARPSIRHPRAALFLSAHGAHPEQQETIPQMLVDFKGGWHAASPLATEANADLQVYELDLAKPSRDFRTQKALDAQDAAQAAAYGMMAVQPGVDLLLVAAPNPVADLAAAEIQRALKAGMDPIDSLLRFGGFDIAAAMGAMIAARLARVPVLVDGLAAEAAADILERLEENAAKHVRKSSALVWEKTDMPVPCRGAMLLPLLKSIARFA